MAQNSPEKTATLWLTAVRWLGLRNRLKAGEKGDFGRFS